MSVASIGGPADVAGIGQKIDANDPHLRHRPHLMLQRRIEASALPKHSFEPVRCPDLNWGPIAALTCSESPERLES